MLKPQEKERKMSKKAIYLDLNDEKCQNKFDKIMTKKFKLFYNYAKQLY